MQIIEWKTFVTALEHNTIAGESHFHLAKATTEAEEEEEEVKTGDTLFWNLLRLFVMSVVVLSHIIPLSSFYSSFTPETTSLCGVGSILVAPIQENLSPPRHGSVWILKPTEASGANEGE